MTKLDQDVSFRLITIQLIDCFHLFSAHTCKERERERETRNIKHFSETRTYNGINKT